MIIGLEVHVQLNTKTKMFTSSDWSYGESPNTQICPITLGYPGTLPTINALAVEKGILIGLSLNCRINQLTKFARKHYFYPDLPKGYQISQFEDPLCEDGYIHISDGRKINIVRAHLEEDAGKTIHTIEGDALIDYNRSPHTQPGLWCHWIPTANGKAIEWDESFKNMTDPSGRAVQAVHNEAYD